MSTVRFGYSHILLYNEAGADLTEEGHAGKMNSSHSLKMLILTCV